MNARKAKMVGAALGLGLASMVAAEGLPRLPGDLPVPKGEDSPGLVIFRHGSHVDEAKAQSSCLACHPRLFGILGRSTGPSPRVTHARMEKGEACGACHGKQAFGFDDCGNCHQQ
jgi:c(7)-type cytochrome triheme protein